MPIIKLNFAPLSKPAKLPDGPISFVTPGPMLLKAAIDAEKASIMLRSKSVKTAERQKAVKKYRLVKVKTELDTDSGIFCPWYKGI